MDNELKRSIEVMKKSIVDILKDNNPSIYLYGSVVLNDFKLGWSDIDILVLTERSITEEQANELVELRQTLLINEPKNLYYRSFEGGMLSLKSFQTKQEDRVVYWGTSGEKITNKYDFDSFCMCELILYGHLIYGKDLRNNFSLPLFSELKFNIEHHYDSIRKFAQETGRNYYSYGWLLDIARSIYTLRTGDVISKTEAGKWALDNNLCPDADALKMALMVRENPLKYKEDIKIFDYAETLSGPIQSFADVLEKELIEKTTKIN